MRYRDNTVQRTHYVFWWGLCEYFVLAVIKAAIILVINFNAAHARKRENERFDKRAVSPPFVLPSCFTPLDYSFTPQHLLQDIPLNPTFNQGIHARSEFYTSDTFKTDKNKQNRTLSSSFSLLFFSYFSHLFLGFPPKRITFFYPCISFTTTVAASLPPLLLNIFSSFLLYNRLLCNDEEHIHLCL